MGSAADRAMGDGLAAVADAVAAHVPVRDPDGGRWLLRLGPGERSVVRLLASAPVPDGDAAPLWATRQLPGGSRPLPWLAWGTDGVTRRWRTRDALTATGYDLVADGAYARLYRELSSGRPPDGGDDTEAYAWAGSVLGRPAGWTELAPTGRTRWFAEVPR
jgi:hypothetical protein